MAVSASRALRRCAAPLAAGISLVTAGCGSLARDELPPPARPADSPPVATSPEGKVGPVRSLPTGLGPIGSARTAVEAGARQAVIDGRARTVTLRQTGQPTALRELDAGVGPTRAVSEGRWLWVVDTRGDALLVFRVRPQLELARRVYLAGSPYAIALDPVRHRLWITLTQTNEVAELSANGRPSEQRRFATVRQPDAVGVDGKAGAVFVRGQDALQRFFPGPS